MTGRRLTGSTIRTGPGDYGPDDVYECPDCADYAVALDSRLRDVVAVILSDGADLDHAVKHARWPEVVAHLDDLRERVEDLELELGEVEAERDRLARVLAVERGDVKAAPDVWEHGFMALAWPRRLADGGTWVWPASEPYSDRTDTALEAMEAADAALAEIDP